MKETPNLVTKIDPAPPSSTELNQTQPMPKTVESIMLHKQITVTLAKVTNHMGNELTSNYLGNC